jgi:hypothetical protein
MKEKVTFTYKNGFSKTRFKNVSDKHLELLKSEICKEQLKRKEAQQFGKVKQSDFKRKFKRFMRRLKSEIAYHAETTAVNHIVGSEQACKSPYIGLIDETVQ